MLSSNIAFNNEQKKDVVSTVSLGHLKIYL